MNEARLMARSRELDERLSNGQIRKAQQAWARALAAQTNAEEALDYALEHDDEEALIRAEALVKTRRAETAAAYTVLMMAEKQNPDEVRDQQEFFSILKQLTAFEFEGELAHG